MRYTPIKIVAIILTVIFAGVLALFIINDSAKEKRQAEHIRQLQIDARPYEQEIVEIRQRIADRKKEMSAVDLRSYISLCFQVKTETDIDWIETKFSSYGYPVTVVLNVADHSETGIKIISKMSKASINMDLMFSNIAFFSENPGVVKQLEEEARTRAVEVVPIWFLNTKEYTNDDIELLRKHGYAGFTQQTDYSANIVTGTTQSGLFYVEHVPVIPGDNKVNSSLKLAVQGAKPLALSFDVSAISADDDYQAYVNPIMDGIQKYRDSEKMDILSMKNIVAENTMKRMQADEKQAAYERYAEEQQLRINELQEKTDEIYSKWKLE